MITEHTPGPWEIGIDKKTIWGPFPRRKMIAEVMADFAVGDAEEQRINAKLIAAAPDLLAACEEVVGWADLYTEVREQLLAAIAKAKG